MTNDRVQKIIAHAGITSRRKAEDLIKSGRVTVNGKVISLGTKANSLTDEIRVDGSLINKKRRHVYYIFNKPRGILTSTKRENDIPTVLDFIPHKTRLYPVGRLDLESEGLVLITNDGELTNLLTHPRYGHEKEYKVLLAKHPNERQLKKWRNGLVLEDGFRTSPAEVVFDRSKGKGAWVRVIMKEGHKRQIRETAKTLGIPVVKLIRIRLGTIILGKLKPREYRELEPEEIKKLLESVKR